MLAVPYVNFGRLLQFGLDEYDAALPLFEEALSPLRGTGRRERFPSRRSPPQSRGSPHEPLGLRPGARRHWSAQRAIIESHGKTESREYSWYLSSMGELLLNDSDPPGRSPTWNEPAPCARESSAPTRRRSLHLWSRKGVPRRARRSRRRDRLLSKGARDPRGGPREGRRVDRRVSHADRHGDGGSGSQGRASCLGTSSHDPQYRARREHDLDRCPNRIGERVHGEGRWEEAEGPTHEGARGRGVDSAAGNTAAARALSRLGDLERARGDMAAALGYYDRALASAERAVGPKDPVVGQILERRIMPLRRAGKTEEPSRRPGAPKRWDAITFERWFSRSRSARLCCTAPRGSRPSTILLDLAIHGTGARMTSPARSQRWPTTT